MFKRGDVILGDWSPAMKAWALVAIVLASLALGVGVVGYVSMLGGG